MSAPSHTDATALTEAVGHHFAPCTCDPRRGHMCAGHEFLLSDPTQRQRVKVWQRLLFVRAERAALLVQEGVLSPVSTPATPDPNVLPW